MSLDVHLTANRPTEVFAANITHNLNKIAEAAGIYQHVWRPEELGITTAQELIEPLTQGLAALRADPAKFHKLNPANGWGDYTGFVRWLEEYLQACKLNPDSIVHVWR